MIDKNNIFRKDFLARVNNFDLQQLTKDYSATKIVRAQDYLLDEKIKCYLEARNRENEFYDLKDGACLGFSLLSAIAWLLDPSVEPLIDKAKKIISLTDITQPLTAVQEEIFESFTAIINHLQKQKAPYSLAAILKDIVDEDNKPVVKLVFEFPLIATKAELENLLKNFSDNKLSFVISSHDHAASFKLEKKYNYFYDSNRGFRCHVPTIFFSDFVDRIATQTHQKIADPNTLYHFNLVSITHAQNTSVAPYNVDDLCLLTNGSTLEKMALRTSYLGVTMLSLAIKRNIEPIIRTLIVDLKINPNKEYFSPLHTAVQFSDVSSIALLLEHGANHKLVTQGGNNIVINNLFNTPEQSYKVTKFLMENRKKYNLNIDVQNLLGNTALIMSLLIKHKKCAKKIIKAGANLNLENQDGHFALQLIISGNFKSLFQLIIDKRKNDVDFEQIYKNLSMNPLQLAVFYQCRKILAGLLQHHQYDMRVVHTSSGEPIIQMAMDAKSKKMLQLLLAHGADINQQNHQSGDTPLHVAVGMSDRKLVKTILSAHPNLAITNADGFTALEEANFGGDQKIVGYFLTYLNVVPQSNIVKKLNNHGMLANKSANQKRTAPLANITNINTSPTKKMKVI